MAALPYMPLYVADYLADAAHLSTLEHGAYLLLIFNYWQRGQPLPADDTRLARIARVSPDEWAAMRDTLAEFFDDDGATWSHSRIDRELDAVRDKSEKARQAGAASAERRLKGRETNVQRSLNGRSTDVQRTFNHTDTDTDTDRLSIESHSARGARRPTKGTRLPVDWQPSEADHAAASALGFTQVQAKREFERFRDYWVAKPGQGGVKLDWPATLRNWLRTSADRAGIVPPTSTGPPVEVAPQFESDEAFQAWWQKRRAGA